MSAEVIIATAVHNIKSNHGSDILGADNKTTKRDYLQKSYKWIINDIQEAFERFEPQKVRRKYIDKPDREEKRLLGIPTIRDRIVQECMRIVMEPIMEAQFFEHSCGFRPMRNTAMVLERLDFITFYTEYYWPAEGDISECSGHTDHVTLLKRFYYVGIKDRRMLQVVKQVSKAGVLDECEVNEEGTMQGGTISPLLANVYLDIMGEWITRQWELKHTEHTYIRDPTRRRVLREANLVPGSLVKYVDDFVIVANNREYVEP